VEREWCYGGQCDVRIYQHDRLLQCTQCAAFTAFRHCTGDQRGIADETKLANIAIYRDQLSELEADLQNGIVSQDQYTQDRDEIERRLLEDTAGAAVAPEKQKAGTIPAASRNTAYAIALGLPIAAVIFYAQVGTPEGITGSPAPVPAPFAAPSASSGSGEPTQEQIEARVVALAKRLQDNPSDAQGWTMLARSYNSMSRFGEAAGASAKASAGVQSKRVQATS
jgi:cytochrome c-type biogenesis protein CcmH